MKGNSQHWNTNVYSTAYVSFLNSLIPPTKMLQLNERTPNHIHRHSHATKCDHPPDHPYPL